MTNIVLLVVDTLRDKELDEKGEKVAPFLNSASQSGLKIDNYRSCASWTAPAHASIFTSMLPSEHGTSTENPYFEEENRLARMMKEKGFHTVCLTENANISKTSGYGSSFDKMTVYSKSEFDGKTWKEVAGLDTEFRSPVHKWLWFWSKSVKTKDVDSMRTFWREFKFKMVKNRL
jgi:arylsulfatase A-like enzyme